MQVTHQHCAGIDVHKKTVVVCCLREADNGTLKRDTRSFGTVTSELLRMSEWLASEGITQVAMESTGEYWKPVYNVLESSYEVMVVNSHHFKQVPGRKTDVKDAAMACRFITAWLGARQSDSTTAPTRLA